MGGGGGGPLESSVNLVLFDLYLDWTYWTLDLDLTIAGLTRGPELDNSNIDLHLQREKLFKALLIS